MMKKFFFAHTETHACEYNVNKFDLKYKTPDANIHTELERAKTRKKMTTKSDLANFLEKICYFRIVIAVSWICSSKKFLVNFVAD